MKTEIILPTNQGIELAACEIRRGGLVAFATETVYGLGANALDADAARKIYAAKGRPSDNPLIVHLCKVEDIESVAFLTSLASKAAKIFMPGALTMVLKKRDCVPDIVTGGLDTVAVRVPANPTAQRLIEACGLPLAAPSANTSTRPSPTTAQHVFDDLNGKIRYILDGGSCQVGLESTIVDFSGEKVRLLRHGGIGIERLREELGEIEDFSGGGGDRPLCPGQKYRHYAPSCRVILVQSGDFCAAANEYNAAKKAGEHVRVLFLLQGFEAEAGGKAEINAAKGNPDFVFFDLQEDYARELFSQFRAAESAGADRIICSLAVEKGLGKSINNRLKKAAGGSNEQ